jgi:hypothetical protein
LLTIENDSISMLAVPIALAMAPDLARIMGPHESCMKITGVSVGSAT